MSQQQAGHAPTNFHELKTLRVVMLFYFMGNAWGFNSRTLFNNFLDKPSCPLFPRSPLVAGEKLPTCPVQILSSYCFNLPCILMRL